jgi:hypothetical protein
MRCTRNTATGTFTLIIDFAGKGLVQSLPPCPLSSLQKKDIIIVSLLASSAEQFFFLLRLNDLADLTCCVPFS